MSYDGFSCFVGACSQFLPDGSCVFHLSLLKASGVIMFSECMRRASHCHSTSTELEIHCEAAYLFPGVPSPPGGCTTNIPSVLGSHSCFMVCFSVCLSYLVPYLFHAFDL